jgi:hypothetical protein
LHSSIIDEKKSSPPKYARIGYHSQMPSVYIHPQVIPTTHRHKLRSYAYLLKAKANRQAKSKRIGSNKKKTSTRNHSIMLTNARDLVSVDPVELDRCRALLQIGQDTSSTTTSPTIVHEDRKSNENKSIKRMHSSNEKKIHNQTTKSTRTRTKTQEKSPPKKVKTNVAVPSNDERSSRSNTNDNPTSVPSRSINKSKRDKSHSATTSTSSSVPLASLPPIIDDTLPTVNDIRRNASIVDRALDFVRHIFQLSDDILNINSTRKESIIDTTQEQQQHYHHQQAQQPTRKLLSIDEFNDDRCELDIHRQASAVGITDDLLLLTSLPRRRLLSIKTDKSEARLKTSRKRRETNKPKVGWAYRYRISRYMAAQKLMQRTGKRNKLKSSTIDTWKMHPRRSSHSTVIKRRLHSYDDHDRSFPHENEM